MSRVLRNNNIIYLETDNLQRYYYDLTQRPIGEGAMGTVYLGYELNKKVPVAIKRVKDKFSMIPAIRERAKLEASLMFSHKNLVEMLGYCEIHPQHGPFFIISRYVHGDTIDQFVSSRLYLFKDAYKRICEMMYPIFDALGYIHSKGIVHLDIKPTNIMVENGRNIRLMDLGIAQVHTLTGSSGTTGMMGTPKYAAPEQFSASANNSSALNVRTDIYELGVTIYELLAKKNPFEGNSLDEIKEKHKKTVLPYVSSIPKEVINVLRIATNPNPQRRYANAQLFKEALAESLKPKQKPIWLWILSAAIALLIVVFVILLFVKQ